MASDCKPSICYICGAKAKCKGDNCRRCALRIKGDCLIGLWDYRTRKEDGNIIWYTICPTCYKEEVNAKI